MRAASGAYSAIASFFTRLRNTVTTFAISPPSRLIINQLAMTDFQLATSVSHWLAKFESALARHEAAALRGLFHADSHWRDVLALTWRIRTTSGREALVAALQGASAHGFRIDPHRTAGRDARWRRVHRGHLPLRDSRGCRRRRAPHQG